MKKIIAMLAVAAMLLTSCGSVPITGRKHVAITFWQKMSATSGQEPPEFMSSHPSHATRIAAATEAYLRYAGLESELQNFAWEFNLVRSDDVNAWCMPGGKIVVYEGIMNLASSDDELAVVIGHEVAHAVAKHSNERMSQQVLAQYGANAIGILTSGKSAATQQIAQQVYGLGAQYGVMQPFSRKHESEADKMGLVLMTIAGYNPDVCSYHLLAEDVGHLGPRAARIHELAPESCHTHRRHPEMAARG